MFAGAAHPYTRALIEAVPRAEAGARRRKRGAKPPGMLSAPENGCAFAHRCGFVSQKCLTEAPELRSLAGGHLAACHHAEMIIAQSKA